MSKEYLEAFKIVYNNFDYLISDVCIENDDVNICLKTIKEQLPTIKQSLQRLESIDNAEPSEALEELIDMIEYFTRLDYVEPIVRNEIHDKFKDIYWHKLPHLDTIKQALLKAQFLEEEYNNLMEDKDNLESELFKLTAPKQYLKWEDLEFKEEEQTMKVLLNGKEYKLSYFTDGIYKFIDLLTDNGKYQMGRYVDCYSYNVQFFNDLRLERVEE